MSWIFPTLGEGERPVYRECGRDRASATRRCVCESTERFHLDLDTLNGHFSSWRYDNATSFSELHTTIKATRLGFDFLWKPALGLWLKDSSSRASLGLQLYRASWTGPLTFRLVRSDYGQLPEIRLFKKTLDLNEDVDVTITWRPHSVVFNVGAESAQVSNTFWCVESIEATASTRDFYLDPLELDSTNFASEAWKAN
jgi:hypothetical protein